MAGGPGPDRRGLPGQRHLPEGSRRPRAAGARRGRHLQVPPCPRGERPARLRRRVRVLVAADGAALSVVVRRERGFDVIQACNPPDTYWLLALLWRRRRRAVRLRPPRPQPRAVPLAVRGAAVGRGACAVRRAALARAAHVPGGGPGHLDERVVPSSRPRARWGAPGAHGGRAQRPGHPSDAAGGTRVGSCARRPPARLPGDHGPAGRRARGAGGHGRAGPRAWTTGRARSAARVRGHPRGPATAVHRTRARRRRRVHRPGRARARSATT